MSKDEIDRIVNFSVSHCVTEKYRRHLKSSGPVFTNHSLERSLFYSSNFFYIWKHLIVTQLLNGLTIRFSHLEVVLHSNLQIFEKKTNNVFENGLVKTGTDTEFDKIWPVQVSIQ